MPPQTSDYQLIRRLCFRLLPIQVLLAVVGAVNGLVSSLFASNFIGTDAMSAMGLYGPLTMFIGAVSAMLMGGAQIICGRYMGKNQVENTQNVFTVNILTATLFSLAAALILFAAGALDLTGIFTDSVPVRSHFNRYLMAISIGIIPQVLGQQLSGFLSLENKNNLTTLAGVVYILANLVLNYLFVGVLKLGTLGLALATSLGLFLFFGIQVQYYLTGRSILKLKLRGIRWKETLEIVKVGSPGALSSGYQTLRGLIINALMLQYVGSVGLSAFAASNSFMQLIWAIPGGMLAVSRMLISVSDGEEDRQSLQDVMRVMARNYLPMISAIGLLIMVFAQPITRLYYQDPSDPVFMMTVWGFRLLPISLPMGVICMHFTCYAQVSGKKLLMHLLPLADGVVGAAAATALLIPSMGMIGVHLANVLNGVLTTVIVAGYAWILNRRIPRNMEQLMVIPEDFGAAASDRLDITVRTTDEVVLIARKVHIFCREKGIDERRAYLSALMVEEMAGNIVSHGFTKDRKPHSVDLRVVHKNGRLILRLRDDCIPFDPAERQSILNPDDITRNIGIRIVYSLAQDIRYQNILGLNVLTIRL